MQLPLEKISEHAESVSVNEADEDEAVNVLGSSMPSVFFDEIVSGQNLKHILEDPSLKD